MPITSTNNNRTNPHIVILTRFSRWIQWSSRRYTISSSYRLNDHCISGYGLVPTSDKTWYGSRGRQAIVNVYWSSDNRSSNWAWCIDLWSVNVASIGVRELRSEAAVGTNLPKDWAINHEQRRYFIDPSSQYQNVSSSQHLHMSIICDHCWSWAKIQQSLSRYFADTCNLYSLAHDTKVGIASRRTATAMVCKSNTKR